MQLFRRALAPVLCGALAVAVLPLEVVLAGPATATVALAVEPDVAVPVAAAAKKPRPPYRVGPGITFNNPLGSRAVKRQILDKQLGAIRHARKGSTIKIMTWNFMSQEGATALLQAQKRGVVVRLIMDASNVDEDTPNPAFLRLKRGLAAGNGKKPPERRSHAKTCKSSCRGKWGAAHSKYFLFSHTGASRYVFMQGSANLTTAAAINQWNELYTFVDREGVYKFAAGIFDQMWRDKPVKDQYAAFGGGSHRVIFSPYAGPEYKSDPVQDAMDQIVCHGAVKAGNKKGRTIVRSAPDVIRGRRGMAAAHQLKSLWDRGCDVRLVYTVMGKDVWKVLRSTQGRGPVPMRHLVQDLDGDGEFDNYFHLKVLTINGVLGKDKSAYVSFNGSSNTSDLASRSDENIGQVVGKQPTLRYQNFIDYWFDNPPPDPCNEPDPPSTCENAGGGNGGGGAARARAVNPYAHVDLD